MVIRAKHRAFAAFAGYVLLIAYGSLIPFDFSPRPLVAAWEGFRQIPYLRLGIQSRADLIANFVLYVPLGYLAAVWAGKGRSLLAGVFKMLAVIGGCFAIAVCIEFTQIFFKPRTVSLNDLVVELLGSATGMGLCHLAGSRLKALWHTLFRGGQASIRAVLVFYMIFYVLVSLFPFDFLVSAEEIAWKVNTFRFHPFLSHAACDYGVTCVVKMALEVIGAIPIGLLLALMAERRNGGLRLIISVGLFLGLSLEALQFLMASGISQGVSILTRMLGVAGGMLVVDLFSPGWLLTTQRHVRLKVWVNSAAALLLVAIAWIAWSGKGGWLSPERGLATIASIHFLPFYYHYFTSESEALTNLLYNAALYLLFGPLCWLGHLRAIRLSLSLRVRRAAVWGAGAAVAVELGKLFLADTHPDPTNVLIGASSAAVGYGVTDWVVAALSAARRGQVAQAPLPASDMRVRNGRWRHSLSQPAIAVAVLLVVIASGTFIRAQAPVERAADEATMHRLPPPEALPAQPLPSFRSERPRLPAPSAAEIVALKERNQPYLSGQHRRAKGGEGDFYAATLLAYMEPGSMNLEALFRRLMAQKVEWRGHEQVKPMAVAYDWLYDQWSGEQRGALRAKLSYGCHYLIDYIRKERLSPYNVYLYNSPLQALMACSIALYGEEGVDDAIMTFTSHYWKEQVLPVWHQVMGKNGGWHEGGEYVGLGIGQAVYQLPAMWRRATGEDVFASEPGLRGFLDFLVYRTRPDGLHFHWGDAAFYDRRVPDMQALALEYGHAAAYSLTRSPQRPTPTSWPWGPLTDERFYDPDAVKRMPLSRYFDGLGMVVARSDWSPDATYITFKAGDNYWSHSHLDQGAFTIYKGGALAIDSGLYINYGSDHHMNYTYQSVAHNTITVTDPGDTVPAPARKGEVPRSIANDGGQRRVGSGWGVEPAPLDLNEWRRKSQIYHTGDMLDVLAEDGLVVAVADVTPAYTNEYSGQGLFSHRSRRVERFWRTVAYDRVDDVVVIFDQVVAARPDFVKRWLLHSLDKPSISNGGFIVSVPPADARGHAGGSLEGHVLLPQRADIRVLGGEGHAFYVDGTNYDEGGRLAHQASGRRNSEQGAWRLELSPASPAAQDLFLVVLIPTLGIERPSHRVRFISKAGLVGAEVVGPARTTRWWYRPGENLVDIDVVAGGVERHYHAGASADGP